MWLHGFSWYHYIIGTYWNPRNLLVKSGKRCSTVWVGRVHWTSAGFGMFLLLAEIHFSPVFLNFWGWLRNHQESQKTLSNFRPTTCTTPRGIGQAMLRIFRQEGLMGLQRGLVAAYLLQFSNVGCRFGFYGSLKQFFGMKQGGAAHTQHTRTP